MHLLRRGLVDEGDGACVCPVAVATSVAGVARIGAGGAQLA